MPVAEFTWITSAECFKAFDGVSQVSAVSGGGEVPYGGRKYTVGSKAILYDTATGAVLLLYGINATNALLRLFKIVLARGKLIDFVLD